MLRYNNITHDNPPSSNNYKSYHDITGIFRYPQRLLLTTARQICPIIFRQFLPSLIVPDPIREAILLDAAGTVDLVQIQIMCTERVVYGKDFYVVPCYPSP